MTEPVKPVVVVSRCLGFAACRWNGQTISDDLVQKLRDHVEFRPVCPEMESGLGVPRDPVRVVSVEGVSRLLQPATGSDSSTGVPAAAPGQAPSGPCGLSHLFLLCFHLQRRVARRGGV